MVKLRDFHQCFKRDIDSSGFIPRICALCNPQIFCNLNLFNISINAEITNPSKIHGTTSD